MHNTWIFLFHLIATFFLMILISKESEKKAIPVYVLVTFTFAWITEWVIIILMETGI